MGHVETKGPHGDFRAQVDVVPTFFLVFQQDRCGRQLQRLRFVIDFVVDQLEDPNLVVVDIDLVLLTDIGQLLTGRIDLMEIGVGHKVATLGRVGDVDMAFERRIGALGRLSAISGRLSIGVGVSVQSELP